MSVYEQIMGKDKYNKILEEETAVAIAYVKEVPLGERLRHDHEHFLEKRVAHRVMDEVLVGVGRMLAEKKKLKFEVQKNDDQIHHRPRVNLDTYDDQI